MPPRNAASVLPDPVGASKSVLLPARIAGQPSRCAAVGSPSVRENQSLTGAEKPPSASSTGGL